MSLTSEITYNGITGTLKTEYSKARKRWQLYVDGEKGFAVISTFANEPTFQEIQDSLFWKGIL